MQKRHTGSSRLSWALWLVLLSVIAGSAIALSDETAPPTGAVVYVQDSPVAAELLETARDRMTKGETEQAAKLMQQVLDQHGQKLLPAGSGYTEARYAVARMLLETPKLLIAYRQIYEPSGAKALQDAGNDAVKLTDALSRYELTDSGLDAGLRLAGVKLEAGEADAASIVLARIADHPNLAARKQLWSRLTASAAAMMGNDAKFADARAALVKAGDTTGVAEVERIHAALRQRIATRPISALDSLGKTDAPRVVTPPLWSIPTDGAENFLLESNPSDRQSIESYGKDGRFLNLMPVVAGSTVYMNDGRGVRAIDITSGHLLWEKRLMETPEDLQALGRTFGRWVPKGLDLNVAAVASQRVVAVIGYSAMVTISPYYRPTNFSQLTCLDARTGAVQWTLSPDKLAEEFGDAFWYGRPIVSEGRVYATLRRRQRTQFQDAYVVALDLRTGATQWMRHLGSTALANRPMPGLDHMVLENGWIYVDSRIGSIAKLSAVDGSVEWLTLVPIDADRNGGDDDTKPWQTSAPVLASGGIVVLDRWSNVIRVLNTDTGAITQTIPSERWHNPSYIQSLGGDVLAIGTVVDRFDGKTLENKWSYTPGGSSIRGRATVTADLMFLPAGDALEVVGLRDGLLVEKMNIELPANVLVMPGQIIAAHRNTLANYTTWQVASKVKLEEIAAHPEDPRPHMGLAWLAFSTGRIDESMQSIDQAARLVAKSPQRSELGREMFGQLMEMIEDGRMNKADVRRQLFDRLAAAAQGPDQEVAYRLALANFYESQSNFTEAATQYQSVLSEPSYRRQLFNHESGSRQAGLEAQRQLKLLVANHGAALYAPFETYAVQRLAQLKQEADPDALAELADAYPLSSVAPEALMLAAQRSVQRNQPRDAASLFRRAEQATRDPVLLAQIFGGHAEALASSGQPAKARRILRQFAASYPAIKPLRAGKPVDVQQWMTELAAAPQPQVAARRVNPPLSGPSRMLRGIFTHPSTTDPEATPAEVIPVMTAADLIMYRDADFKELWRYPINGHPDLLALDRNRTWLWDAAQQTIRVIDTETGKLRWEDSTLSAKLAAIKAPEPRVAENREFQPFQQRILPGGVIVLGRGARPRADSEPLVAVSDVAMAVADERGRVVVLNPENGKMLWQGSTPLRSATDVMLEGRFLILVGADEDDSPLICIFDAQTGQIVHRLLSPRKQPILWAGVAEGGVLVSVSMNEIQAFDLNRGQATWVCKPGTPLTGDNNVWLSPDRLVVQTRDDDLLWLDLSDGRVVNRMQVRSTVQAPLRLYPDAEGWIIIGADHCVATTPDGVKVWRDALGDNVQIAAWDVADRFIVLLSRHNDTGGTLKLNLLDRAGGAIRYQDDVATNRPIEDVNVVGSRLFLTGGGATGVLESTP